MILEGDKLKLDSWKFEIKLKSNFLKKIDFMDVGYILQQIESKIRKVMEILGVMSLNVGERNPR